MKYLALLLLFPTLSFASMFTDCGEYTVKAVVRAGPANFAIIVNEKTQSESIINFPITESQKLGAYMDRSITAVVLLDKAFNGTVGLSEKIVSVTSRIPDPLNPKDTGFILTKKVDCKKI